MAPKPASTAGKAPASTASKAPAKTTEGAKGAKKTSKPVAADENLDDLFSGITDNSKPKKSTTASKTSKSASKPVAGADDDIFADIESQLTEKPASRPHTPRAGKRST